MPFDPTLQDKGSWFYDTSNGQTAPLVGDGVTYSRALGWQSPEGNFYGQERWVRDWYSAVFWDGLDYRIVEADGTLDDPALFSIKAPPNRTPTNFEVWSVPRPNWPPIGLAIYDGRDKDYYFWNPDKQAFTIMEWFWQVEGDDELLYPGVKIGAAHVIVYHDIKVMWNGYYWQRYHHDMLDLGTDADIHIPEGFLAQNQANIEGLITGLESAQTAISANSTQATTDIAALNTSITTLQDQIAAFSSTSEITYAEAQAMELSQTQLTADASILEGIATDLGITTQLTAYESALTILGTALASFVNQPTASYPVAVTSAQQSAINSAFSAATSAQSALQAAIGAAQASGVQVSLDEFKTLVNSEFTTVNGTLSNFDTQFEQYASDGYVSQAEAQSLSLTLGQIVAASTEVISGATALSITTEVTAYQAAIAALQTTLAPWVGQTTYPIAITTTGTGTANQRATIEAAFAQVKETEVTLQNTIIAVSSSDAQAAAIAAVDATITTTNGNLTTLTNDFNTAFSGTSLTIIESNQFASDLGQLQASSTTLTNEATTLGITTEQTNYTTALAALVSGLAPWINQSSYPIAITSTQRSALTALFQATQTAETVLVNKIDSVNSANALTSANSNTTTQIGYVNSSIDNINTTLSSAGQSLATLNNDLVALSSATELTLAEAKALAYDLSQAQAQLGTTGDTLYTIAQSLGITTQLTNYSNAVAALALGLAPWVEI
jgi:hypothetical protein